MKIQIVYTTVDTEILGVWGNEETTSKGKNVQMFDICGSLKSLKSVWILAGAEPQAEDTIGDSREDCLLYHSFVESDVFPSWAPYQGTYVHMIELDFVLQAGATNIFFTFLDVCVLDF